MLRPSEQGSLKSDYMNFTAFLFFQAA